MEHFKVTQLQRDHFDYALKTAKATGEEEQVLDLIRRYESFVEKQNTVEEKVRSNMIRRGELDPELSPFQKKMIAELENEDLGICDITRSAFEKAKDPRYFLKLFIAGFDLEEELISEEVENANAPEDAALFEDLMATARETRAAFEAFQCTGS